MVYPYRNVKKALQKIFHEAELSEFAIPGSDCNTKSDPMLVILMMLEGICGVFSLKFTQGSIAFDDETPKKTRSTPLKLPRFTNSHGFYRGLQLIPGGRPESKNDDPGET